MTKIGKLIVIEGTDSSGKETQAKRLCQTLVHTGIKCEYISFPRYETPTGRMVGECYLGKPRVEYEDRELLDAAKLAFPESSFVEIFKAQAIAQALLAKIPGKSWFDDPTKLDPRTASLYYAADRREAARDIFRILGSGTHLVSNRYVESNMGHQGGKITNEDERERLFEDLDLLEHGILKLPRPDLVIFLHMPLEVAKKLNKGRGQHKDAHESSDEHLRNAEAAYLQLAKLRSWTRIECAPNGYPPRSEDDIAKEISDKVLPLLSS